MRRAIIQTPADRPAVIAAALTPDHTDEMRTEVSTNTIRTEITRPSTRSLQTTTDDYLVNLAVATRLDAWYTANEPTDEYTNDQTRTDNQ